MVTFPLSGETSISYLIRAPNTAGSHTLSGTLEDDEGATYTIGGTTAITVQGIAVPNATRTFDPDPVAKGWSR